MGRPSKKTAAKPQKKTNEDEVGNGSDAEVQEIVDDVDDDADDDVEVVRRKGVSPKFFILPEGN